MTDTFKWDRPGNVKIVAKNHVVMLDVYQYSKKAWCIDVVLSGPQQRLRHIVKSPSYPTDEVEKISAMTGLRWTAPYSSAEVGLV